MKKIKILMLIVLFCIQSLYSFGLKTHTFIGKEILNDIKNDCKLKILDNQYEMKKNVCTAIKKYPYSFLSGVLGPDIYPDLIVGQTTTHPGVEGHWKTDDWLKHYVKNAKDDKAIAFAYGVLVHASSDIFAHTYVNAYAGDTFELLDDERSVERRHFVLEKYIDAHLPKFSLDVNKLTIPSAYLRDLLILNKDAINQYKYSKSAPHLISMYGTHKLVKNLNSILRKHEQNVGKYFANIIKEKEKNISENEEDTKEDIDTLGITLTTAKNKITNLTLDTLLENKEKLDKEILNINKNLKNTVEIIEHKSCTNTCKTAFSPWVCRKVNDGICFVTSTVVNPIYTALNEKKKTLQNKYDKTKQWIKFFKKLNAQYKIDLSMANEALEALNKPLYEALEYAKGISNKFPNTTFLSSYTTRWLNSMEKASLEYINTSLNISKHMLDKVKSTKSPLELYNEWLSCHAPAFTSIPMKIVKNKCVIASKITSIKEKLNEDLWELLPNDIEEKLKDEIESFDKKLLDFITDSTVNSMEYFVEDSSADFFLKLLITPENATRTKLNEVYKNDYGAENKKILEFDNIASDYIDKDLGFNRDKKITVEKFNALNYAIKLSKISLLSVDGINKMIVDIGEDNTLPKYKNETNPSNFSALFNWVGSLDGNHQWGIYGLPYSHQDGKIHRNKYEKLKFGLNKSGKNKGFKLFHNDKLRENVFLKIFPSPVGGLISLNTDINRNQPFEINATNPFPVTFKKDGKPIICNDTILKNCFDIKKECRLEAKFSNDGLSIIPHKTKEYIIKFQDSPLGIALNGSTEGKNLRIIKNIGRYDASIEIKGFNVPSKWKALNTDETYVGLVDLQTIKCFDTQKLTRSWLELISEDITQSKEAVNDSIRELLGKIDLVFQEGGRIINADDICKNPENLNNKFSGSKNKFQNFIMDDKYHEINNYLMMQASGKTFYNQIRHKTRAAQTPAEFMCGTQELYQHWGFEDVKFVNTRMSSNAIVASNRKMVVIAIRGTEAPFMNKNTQQFSDDIKGVIDLAVNINKLPKLESIYSGVGLVHLGYASAGKLLANEISKIKSIKNKKIYITGHSLGGATAIMLSFYLKTKYLIDIEATYTFASPEVGDEKFTRSLYKLLPFYMTQNYRDPIPNVGRNPFNVNNIEYLASTLYASRYTTIFDSIHKANVFEKNFSSRLREKRILEIQKKKKNNSITPPQPITLLRKGLLSNEWHFHHPNFYVAHTYQKIRDFVPKNGTGIEPEFSQTIMCILKDENQIDSLEDRIDLLKNKIRSLRTSSTTWNRLGNNSLDNEIKMLEYQIKNLLKTTIGWNGLYVQNILESDSQMYPFINCK